MSGPLARTTNEVVVESRLELAAWQPAPLARAMRAWPDSGSAVSADSRLEMSSPRDVAIRAAA